MIRILFTNKKYEKSLLLIVIEILAFGFSSWAFWPKEIFISAIFLVLLVLSLNELRCFFRKD
jgi:hypothetical protein